MKIIINILISLALFTSCSDWFDVSSENKLSPDKGHFRDEAAFMNALTGVYTQLRVPEIYGENLSIGALEFMSQNFQSSNVKYTDFAKYNYAAQSDVVKDIWLNMYNAIAQCNNVIDNIETTTVVFNNKGQKDIIKGELYALRGALHFDLLRLFHPSPAVNADFVGMPYMKHFSSEVSAPQSTKQVIDQIIADLTKATELLRPVDPILKGWSHGTVLPGSIDSRLRTFFMNYYATTSVLARVYLYSENYTKAAEYANEAFNHSKLVDKRNQLFYYFGPGQYGSDLSFSREHIFGISTIPSGFTQLAQDVYNVGNAKTMSSFTTVFNDAEDTRYRAWFTFSGDKYYMAPKFGKESILSGYISAGAQDKLLPVRIPFIKLGEVALIAAESMLKGGASLNDAAVPVVELQKNRGLTMVKDMLTAGTLTNENFIQIIEQEYHRELFGEGQLFYYFKRCNKSSIETSDGTMRTMTSTDYVMPIPKGNISL